MAVLLLKPQSCNGCVYFKFCEMTLLDLSQFICHLIHSIFTFDQHWIRRYTKELRKWPKDTQKTTINCTRFLRRSWLVVFVILDTGLNVWIEVSGESTKLLPSNQKQVATPTTSCVKTYLIVSYSNFILFPKNPVLNLINRYMEKLSETISHTAQLSSLNASKVISWKAPQLWDATTGSGTQHCQCAQVNFTDCLLKS